MAHLWVQGIDGDWATAQLTDNAYHLSEGGLSAVEETAIRQPRSRFAMLVRKAAGREDHWTLLSNGSSRVRVNGSPVVLGMRVLDDHDEIVVQDAPSSGGGRCFFSTEQLAEAKPFPGTEQPVHCPRCKQAIQKGDSARQDRFEERDDGGHGQHRIPPDHASGSDQRCDSGYVGRLRLL